MAVKPRVYIETNFLIEAVLDQDKASACTGILDLAKDDKITLAIPAVTFAEAAETLRRRRSDLREVQKLAERRAKAKGLHRTAAAREISALIVQHVVQIDARRTSVFMDILRVATTIDMTSKEVMEMIKDEELKPPDAVVLACIRAHVTKVGGGQNVVFITSDKRLALAAELEKQGCHESIYSLDGGLAFLESLMSPKTAG